MCLISAFLSRTKFLGSLWRDTKHIQRFSLQYFFWLVEMAILTPDWPLNNKWNKIYQSKTLWTYIMTYQTLSRNSLRERNAAKIKLKHSILDFSTFPIHLPWICIVKFERPRGRGMTSNQTHFSFCQLFITFGHRKKAQPNPQKKWKYETPFNSCPYHTPVHFQQTQSNLPHATKDAREYNFSLEELNFFLA